ncbi:MAG: YdcF family protein [Phycisphaerales bacterium]|nr:YdcF family protein [Phycisphaerales bacterium]MCB9863700.1 YdcF family protein [Phycisphaerales bacterium]
MTIDDASLSDSPGGTPAPPSLDQKRFRRLRRGARIVVYCSGVSAILAALFIFSPIFGQVYAEMDAQDPLVRADYIICLGGDSARVIESARLLQEGYAPKMIVSNFGAEAERMRTLAIDWGASADRIVVDAASRRTADHPACVAKAAGIDKANDACIIVTSYTHMRRARAVFEKAGYRHIVMQEPRWERESRDLDGMSWRGRFLVFPKLVYEGAGWLLYWVRGDV